MNIGECEYICEYNNYKNMWTYMSMWICENVIICEDQICENKRM